MKPRPGTDPTGMLSTTKIDLLLRQPHHVVSGVVEAEIAELEVGAASVRYLLPSKARPAERYGIAEWRQPP